MRKRSNGREQPLARPIALVCISKHEPPGPAAKEPDKLTTVRGKWAWCPSGATAGHDWQPVKAGSLNALRVQLVEVSRLVDVAINSPRKAMEATNAAKGPKARGKRR
jgi:hypothetical protein